MIQVDAFRKGLKPLKIMFGIFCHALKDVAIARLAKKKQDVILKEPRVRRGKLRD